MTSSHPPVRKPVWLKAPTFNEMLDNCNWLPCCAYIDGDGVRCGATEDLTVDHIVPRYLGGADDIGNLQFMCRRHNSIKGIRPDLYWSQGFYWDKMPNIENLRGAQRLLFRTITEDRVEWFGRTTGEITRYLYVNAMVVGAGKTICIAVAAWALNHVIQDRWGHARRADRVLVIAKDAATRDQIAADLETDIVAFGILSEAPRVGVVVEGWQLQQTGWIDDHDLIVTTEQMLWQKNGAYRHRLPEILAHFPVIAYDEPHFADSQIANLVDMASSSLCFGFTGTPIDATGNPLSRMVALTVFSYQQAIAEDRSLKYLDSEAAHFPMFVKELGIHQADLSEHGRPTVTTDPRHEGYEKNAAAPMSVVRAVIEEMKRRDELNPAYEMAAPHRRGYPAAVKLLYPVHALIVCDNVALARQLQGNTNKLFGADQTMYPPDQGWQAEVVFTDTQDEKGKPIAGRPLTPTHAWMRAKRIGYVTDARCARILFVVGIGREGVNNQLCGIVGVACGRDSLIEAVQRWLGRQLRAVTAPEGQLLLVAPALLDTVLIVTHETFKNTDVIKAAIKFVTEMDEALRGLTTIDELESGELRDPKTIEREVSLPLRDKLDICGFIQEAQDAGADLSDDEIVRAFAPRGGRRAELVREWGGLILSDPEAARRECRFDVCLKHIPIVIREYVRYEARDAELERHAKIHVQALAHRLPISDDNRDIFLEFYRQHAARFHLPPLTSKDSIDKIRKRLAGRVISTLGRQYAGDDRLPFSLTGAAVKKVLGVPDGQSASLDSEWDRPQHHAVLNRPEVQDSIARWVINVLIDEGHCPKLSALRAGVLADVGK